MEQIPYSCHLLDIDGRPSESVTFECDSDASALLAGHALKQARESCTGYEIRRSGVLIYRHQLNPRSAAGKIRRQTLVLVEDDAVFRDAAASHLRDEGFRVIELSDALAALTTLDGPVRVDLLVSDVKLPPQTLHGVALARMVQVRWPKLPIILVTGYPALADGHADVARQVLFKPIELPILAEAVRAALTR